MLWRRLSASRRGTFTARGCLYAPPVTVRAVAGVGLVLVVAAGAVFAESGPSRAAPRAGNGLIAYVAGDSQGRSQVFTIHLDGTARKQLTDSVGQNLSPAWSADGTRIAFTSTRTGTSELWVMDAHGRHQTELTFPPLAGGNVPSCSSDGTTIAFSASEPSSLPTIGVVHTEIWVVGADGSHTHRLTSSLTPSGSNAPSWSPDGRRIAFASDRSGTFEAY